MLTQQRDFAGISQSDPCPWLGPSLLDTWGATTTAKVLKCCSGSMGSSELFGVVDFDRDQGLVGKSVFFLSHDDDDLVLTLPIGLAALQIDFAKMGNTVKQATGRPPRRTCQLLY